MGADGTVGPAAMQPLGAPIVQRRYTGDGRDRRGEVPLKLSVEPTEG
jgi:hypothetical protein